jgi:hypothetical protein
MIVTGLGWLLAGAGLALVLLSMLGAMSAFAGPILGLPGGFIVGLGAIAAGLLIALIGLMALAVFEAADRTRQTEAIVRARADL